MNVTPTPSPRPRFDANAAWKSAAAVIKANRQLLIVLAGVFFLLPQLLVDFVVPQAPAGLEGEALQKAVMDIYASWWPVMLAGLVAQGTGLLAVIALISGRDRPTVQESCMRALRYLPTLIAAQLVVGAGVGLAMLLVLVPFAAMGGGAMFIAVLPALALAAWIYARTMLIAPVVVGESLRNPFDAIMRSWRLTNGNAARLLAFFVLLLVVTLVVWLVATNIPGAIATVLAGAHAGRVAMSVFGSVVAAVFSLISAAVLTAAWIQLAGEQS